MRDKQKSSDDTVEIFMATKEDCEVFGKTPRLVMRICPYDREVHKCTAQCFICPYGLEDKNG